MNIEESFFDNNYAAAGISVSVLVEQSMSCKHDNIYSTSDQYIDSDVVYQCLFTCEVY